ncbi:MAG: RhuM family protein [Candidatus Omnitrophica bacterium]|jgi:prophage maintenance system killer protein|nr:RhuM family protein [Candidatus Omnitrophota bacterium]
MTKKLRNIEGGKVVLYKKGLEVQLREETVWLNQAQMVLLFRKTKQNISLHINNIFKEGELRKDSVIKECLTTANDGKKYKTSYYNLDVIISVGYRIKSKQGTLFRIWATRVLKQHLIEGYTINEKRLKRQEQKYFKLKNAVNLIGNVVQIENLSPEAKGLAQVISEYTRALDILDDFDNGRLKEPKGKKSGKYKMTYQEARAIIETMKEKFKDSDIVGQEKDQGFKSSLGAIYQSAGGKDAYPTIQEKAAHLLYFVTKNHNFVDGNKRIAAALFICFLKGNGILYRKDGSRIIDDNALVALTLMIAASNPKEKDVMVKVITNLIC